MSTLRMLIVDDEALLRTLLTALFESMGHSVRTAADGFAALVEMKDYTPNIILSDLNMPSMSGFEFLSVIRRRFPGVAVIAMSGAFPGTDIPTGVAADAFYEKGGDLNDLIRLVKGMTEPELTSGRNHVTTIAPFWIPASGHDAGREPYVVVGCPDCLRTFPQPVDETSGAICVINCVHCHTPIQYAIVPAPMPGFVGSRTPESHAGNPVPKSQAQ